MGDSWDWGPQRRLFEFPGARVVYRKKGLAWPHRITHASRKTYSTYQQPSTYLYSVHLATATQLSVSIERADVDRFIRAYLKTVSHRLPVSLSHANTGKMGFYCNKWFAKRFLE